MLLRGEQRHSLALGRHIMEGVDDAERVIDLVLSGLQTIPKDERNPALLGSEFRVFGIAVNSYATSRIGRLSNHNIEK